MTEQNVVGGMKAKSFGGYKKKDYVLANIDFLKIKISHSGDMFGFDSHDGFVNLNKL